jgi:hypothetical protein
MSGEARGWCQRRKEEVLLSRKKNQESFIRWAPPLRQARSGMDESLFASFSSEKEAFLLPIAPSGIGEMR